ncbi:hypothetical protein Pyn_11821 [Prunus yedoensis var. nudiflora]|uniref:HIG1 domain-containing protein n=1 Tax=Prunus yedoensis var. nudiflora TaxID=2094558 RepID=A0A314YDG1_PRUYE|nr:hypothetical protein Pyn_11821 [Prunus yedoensis var. nudiflora]
MEKVEPTLEVFYEEKKRVKNPWVPVGALLTAGVLTAGLISFRQGNSQLGQKLMRATCGCPRILCGFPEGLGI